LDFNTAVSLPAGTDVKEFAGVITGEIMSKYEKPLLYRITEHEFPYTSPKDRVEIFNLALKHATLDTDDMLDAIHYNRRRALIEEQAAQYLSENSYIIINGFVNFRLEEYKDELRTLCHNAAEELYATREYDEFLNMLRFFVSVQAPKEGIVHIVKKDETLRIYNKRRRDITDLYADEIAFSSEDFTPEDIVLSALITIAPRKIVIHDNKENDKLYDTIANVFSDVKFART